MDFLLTLLALLALLAVGHLEFLLLLLLVLFEVGFCFWFGLANAFWACFGSGGGTGKKRSSGTRLA